jgi:hypothetical protein
VTADILATVLATTPIPGTTHRVAGRHRTLGDGLTRQQLEVLAGAARAALAAPVLELHVASPGTSSCRECLAACPCPTVRALGVAPAGPPLPARAYLAAGSASTKRHLRSREYSLSAACGRSLVDTDTAIDASTVRAADRCRQSGCVGGWVAIDRGVAS